MFLTMRKNSNLVQFEKGHSVLKGVRIFSRITANPIQNIQTYRNGECFCEHINRENVFSSIFVRAINKIIPRNNKL